MRPIVRMLYFSLFTLVEYVRSWRILVELLVSAAFFYGFFVNHWGSAERDVEHFFTLTSVFLLILTLYTTSSVLHLGDRPQGYVLLARRLGRTSYIIGLYLTGMSIIAAMFTLIGFAAFWYAEFIAQEVFNLSDWLLGTPPLLLNVGLLIAFLFLISPLILSTGWRLFTLSLIALAVSGNFISGPVWENLPPTIQKVLSSLQTLLSWPLVPILSGFSLATSKESGLNMAIILLAQFSLLVSVIGLALYVFSQRDIVFYEE